MVRATVLGRFTRTTTRRQAPSRRGFFDAWSRVYDHPLVQWATYRPVHDAVLAAVQAELEEMSPVPMPTVRVNLASSGVIGA